jgi:hypothetical protein
MTMHPKKKSLLIIILLGGSSVLSSYVLGFLLLPSSVGILWGGVPPWIRPIYTVNMLLAASGFFAFTYFFLFQLEATSTLFTGKSGLCNINRIYLAILVPSALWLPLAFFAITQYSLTLAWLARGVLIVVGAASLVLLFILLRIELPERGGLYWPATGGCILFCIQTVIMDAMVWGITFRI